MHAFRTVWRAGTQSRPELDIFGLDRESDINSMQMLAGALMNASIEEVHAERLATIFHYFYGAAAGILYLALTVRAPLFRAGCGTLYGAAIWLFGDEIPINLAGVTDRRRKVAASHAAALAAHLLYAVVTDLILRRASNSLR